MLALKCLVGIHTPDRAAAVREPMYFTTRCAGCGKPMRRISKGRWVIKAGASETRGNAAGHSTPGGEGPAARTDSGHA